MTDRSFAHDGCFHCGQPLATGRFPVEIGGSERMTCCRGCQAVAQAIVANGLESYYRTRSSPALTPSSEQAVMERLRLYDLPEMQSAFVRVDPRTAHEKEAALLLDGMTCAACAWLIQRRIESMPGVRAAAVNFAAQRARISWDDRVACLSDILGAVQALGYAAEPYDSARVADKLERERRGLLWRLFVAGFGMMQVMMYAVPVYMAEGSMSSDIERLMHIAGLILTAPVVAWAATPFYRGAIRELGRRRLGMDVPIALAIIAAFVASAAATLSGSGDVYFDSVTMFVFLLLGARYLEFCARQKATDAQARLAKLAPAVAERLPAFPGLVAPEQVPAASLRPDDIVLVRAGATVPADGEVIDGHSATDESLLTGESRSVWKSPGDPVVCGAINKHEPLVIRVQRVGEQSMLSGLVRLMDRAQSQRPEVARAADRAARVFVAMVLLLALGTAIAWSFINPARVLWVSIALLVVSCPCALSLATPTAITAATGALYRVGVLLTRAHALETLARATHFVFDKTGTLTAGELHLAGVLPLSPIPKDACLRIAAALEAQSEHPLARAIVRAGDGRGDLPVCERRSVQGKGVEGRIEGRRVRIGTPEFVAELHAQPLPETLLLVSDEVGVVALGDEGGWLALITYVESPRLDARRLVRSLHTAGATVCLLSGDRSARVARIAAELGIEHLRARATPDDKVEYVRELQRQGAIVAMIGDGVNDAPVLAQAQVSVAMGSGADLAQGNADIVLMRSQLAGLLCAVSHAKRTLRIVRQNLAWATLYNAVALPLAALGLVTPLVAAIGMSLSSLLVVLNALRLVSVDAGPGMGDASALHGGGRGVGREMTANETVSFEAGLRNPKQAAACAVEPI